MFYLAYGSNLCVSQMRKRCPDAKPVGTVSFRNWRLMFRGVADIVAHEGSTLHMGVWTITKRCERALDIYEGVKNGLYLKEYMPIDVTYQGTECRVGALVYIMNRGHYAMPHEGYYDTIARGYRDFGLPLSSLAQAVYDTQEAMEQDEAERYAKAKARGTRKRLRPPIATAAE